VTAAFGENDSMTPILAAYADQVILDAFLRFLPIAGIAAIFGFVYWLFRRAKSKREDAARKAWLDERRAMRGAEKKESADR
jgi:hypothetical protein